MALAVARKGTSIQQVHERKYPSWEVYERMIARIIADQLSTDYCVTPNAHVTGRITGIRRQLDVLIETRHESDNSRRIVVDAKKRSRKIDVTDVEAFIGLMGDIGATHGYLVCTAGHTSAAEQRAQSAVSIRLVPLDRLEDFDPTTWPKCVSQSCRDGRVFWDGYPAPSLQLLATTGPDQGKTFVREFVHYVGKCDRCGHFHVKCVTCGDMLGVPEGDENDYGHQCSCKLPWFWLASIEEDENGVKSAELHNVLGTDKVITVDRRSL